MWSDLVIFKLSLIHVGRKDKLANAIAVDTNMRTLCELLRAKYNNRYLGKIKCKV